MIGLHHIISLFIYSLISFFNRKNNPHFHPSSYVGTLTSFLTSSSALELAFPSDAERCFFAENGGYPPTQNGDIRSLFWLFSLMALQN